MARKGLLERLAEGPVICAEGYLLQLERRGADADVVGLNCSRGPATMLLAIERIR